jgi:hypothetical protein
VNFSGRSDRNNSEQPIETDSLQQLLKFLLSFAAEMLADAGSFLPFGAGVTADGELTATPSLAKLPAADPRTVLAAVFTDLRLQASSGSINAAGICTNVQMSLPGAPLPADAICLELEDRAGRAVEVFVPYTIGSGAPLRLGEAVITGGEPSIFVASAD